jgi:hypothetical protein
VDVIFLGHSIKCMRNHFSDEFIVFAQNSLELRKNFLHVGVVGHRGFRTQLSDAFIEWMELHRNYRAPVPTRG